MSTITNAIKIRYNQVYTAASSLMFKRPYMQGQPTKCETNTGGCPICKGQDSVGHILGACKHTTTPARYVARHNKAVTTIYDAYDTGKKGGSYTIMDAPKKEDLPVGVSGNRVPSWVLPEVQDIEREKMRPDTCLT